MESVEIIKHGNQYNKIAFKNFECPTCGCVFMVDNTKFSKTVNSFSVEYHAKCPECATEIKLIYTSMKDKGD